MKEAQSTRPRHERLDGQKDVSNEADPQLEGAALEQVTGGRSAVEVLRDYLRDLLG